MHTHTPLHSNKRWPTSFMVAMLLLLCVQHSHASPSKIALVIGNASYEKAPLKNATNDTRLVHATLENLGYEVTLLQNKTQTEMIQAMENFWRQSSKAQARVFYFAGHGLQYQGKNYLIPIDAKLKTELDIPKQSASIDDLIQRLGAHKQGVNILIVDACRTYPIPKIIDPENRRKPTTKLRSLGQKTPKGLAPQKTPLGTLVAYSTAPGELALDGKDAFSPYVLALIKHIQTPGLPVEQMFKRVRLDVRNTTQGEQTPWESNSLIGEFCFATGPDGKCQ